MRLALCILVLMFCVEYRINVGPAPVSLIIPMITASLYLLYRLLNLNYSNDRKASIRIRLLDKYNKIRYNGSNND